jgi:hypothetical protein
MFRTHACFSCAAPGGAGLRATDFALYVTAVEEPYCRNSAVLAMGAPCETDPFSGRPLSGNANFCPRALALAAPQDGDSAAWGMQLDTVMHETLHALGFSGRWLKRFVGEDGASPLAPAALAELSDWAARAMPRSHVCVLHVRACALHAH